jgi:tetratricopeptide (TPR) repeat protein
MRIAKLMIGIVVVAAVALGAQSFSFEEIRNDLFAGATGDAAALQRAMSTAERILKDNPANPSAMVIHGWATVISASHEGGNAAAEMSHRGITEVNQAVALAPDEPFVRIMRGILMQVGSRNVPPPLQAPMLENARSDFERVFDLQQNVLDELGTHRLGELLQALGDVHARLGRNAEAERYYAMIQQKLPRTEYARRADEWTRTKQPLPAEKTTCVGCHAGGR